MSTEIAVLKMSPNAIKYAKPLEDACIAHGIVEGIHKAHFLAQVAHESMGFTTVAENLNYSAKGLRATFGKYFNTAQANMYARQPERIANHVYANRLGNGDEASGDGWRYRGRGLIQTTGRDNYAAFSMHYYGDLRLLTMPENLSQNPILCADSAGYFWQKNNLNKLVDEDTLTDFLADNDDIKQVTRRINGGYNGLEDREHWLTLAKKAFLSEMDHGNDGNG